MRAWGPTEWLLQRLPQVGEPLVVLGSLASEERCTAIPLAAASHSPERILLLKIIDPPSRFSGEIEEKSELNYRKLKQVLGSRLDPPLECSLLDGDEDIGGVFRFLDQCSSPIALWIDITSLPKRFFFLLVKIALRDPRVSDLLVTYVQPAPGRYTEEHLAEDPGDVQPLPGFGLVGNDPESLVIAVGFEALGLPQLLGEYPDKRRLVLVPFPPGQPYSRRIWQTVMSIGHPGDANIRRVPALDVFEAFDMMMEDVRPEAGESGAPALAPYGPKPISLSMCLFAVKYGSPVYYTQPRIYHPNYTIGIGRTWAYSLKRGGREVWFEP